DDGRQHGVVAYKPSGQEGEIMKNVIASTAVVIASVLVSVGVRADCTRNPFALGWDAARQACDDIASGFLPRAPRGREGASPERPCSSNDVIRCKNAMAQFLRDRQGRECARLIDRDVPVENAPGNTAGQVWRNYVMTTCNQ